MITLDRQSTHKDCFMKASIMKTLAQYSITVIKSNQVLGVSKKKPPGFSTLRIQYSPTFCALCKLMFHSSLSEVQRMLTKVIKDIEKHSCFTIQIFSVGKRRCIINIVYTHSKQFYCSLKVNDVIRIKQAKIIPAIII